MKVLHDVLRVQGELLDELRLAPEGFVERCAWTRRRGWCARHFVSVRARFGVRSRKWCRISQVRRDIARGSNGGVDEAADVE